MMNKIQKTESKKILCLIVALVFLLVTPNMINTISGTFIEETEEAKKTEEFTEAEEEATTQEPAEEEPEEETEEKAEEEEPEETTEEEPEEEEPEEELEEEEPKEEFTEEPEEPEETEEETEQSTNAPNILLGSISGFLWVDGNGSLPTYWDSLYNGDEYPLAGFTVYLFTTNNLSVPIFQTQTDWDGTYIFKDLEPGVYIVGLRSGFLDDLEFLLPMKVTDESVFTINWMSVPVTAYSGPINIVNGEAAENINAGMRLPMRIQRTATIKSLADLLNANKNDTIVIDGYTWCVVKTQTISKENYIYLIMVGNILGNAPFGSTQNYNTSDLRDNMKWILDTKRLPTIHAIAVEPILGDHYNMATLTTIVSNNRLIPIMAGTKTEDILFAPSNGDMREWINGNTTSTNTSIPAGHPLRNGSAYSFPSRFYGRTAVSDKVSVTGINRTANQLDYGILASSATYAMEVPCVWVRAGAVNRTVNIYHIDTAGNLIGPNPNPDPQTVLINNTFTLTASHIRTISGYTYKEWKIGISGTPANGSNFTNPTLTAAQVIEGTDIYLIYEPAVTALTISKIVTGGGDTNKKFKITVQLANSAGTSLAGDIDYTGSINGTQTLNGGKITFELMHDQSVTIHNVPTDGKVRVYEEKFPDPVTDRYKTFIWDSYFDSSQPKPGPEKYDTGQTMLNMTTKNRTLEFTNERKTVPPTGIDLGGKTMMLFPIFGIFAGAASLTIKEVYLRRKKIKER